MYRRVVLGMLALALGAASVYGQGGGVRGVVRDRDGAAVAGASVVLEPADGSGAVRAVTDREGVFEFPNTAATAGWIVVEADGFAKYEGTWTAGSSPEIMLQPAGVAEQVTVMRTEARIDETPASVVAMGRDEIQQNAAATVDDKLRQVPGFTLFRRAGSRAANPTAQGSSLRGIGASGASRTVVLADGVPLNDPFGGWIYWGSVPVESLERVEVLRGAASDLYGSSAIGGVVSLVTRQASERPVLDIEASYGNARTPIVSGFAAAGAGGWNASLSGEFFRSDGFVIVDERERGGADVRANAARGVLNPYIERKFANGGRVFAAASYFEERRENGTPLQNNDTRIYNAKAGGDAEFGRFGSIAARVYAGRQMYHQSFSAVADDRNSESLVRLQTVPAQVVGYSAQWTGNAGRRLTLIAGSDGREVRGRSDETGFFGGSPSAESSAGGREAAFGVFGGGILTLGRLTLSGGLRYDRWKNFDGYSATRSLRGPQASLTAFPDRSESAVSPRGSVLFRINRYVSAAASAASAFRAPTLNELYRGFRVGDVQTLANENLRAERSTGGEAGILVNGFGRRLFARGTAFCTEVSRNIANVTLSVTPSLITRQRQNLGRTRACGFEADGQYRVSEYLSFTGGYLFVDSRVISFPANAELEGLRIPQTARHQGSFQVMYSDPAVLNAAVQVRAAGRQFDDDQNLLPLAGFVTADARVSRRFGRKLEVFGAVENLFDSRVETGRTPVLTLTAQRAFRVGVRVVVYGRK